MPVTTPLTTDPDGGRRGRGLPRGDVDRNVRQQAFIAEVGFGTVPCTGDDEGCIP